MNVKVVGALLGVVALAAAMFGIGVVVASGDANPEGATLDSRVEALESGTAETPDDRDEAAALAFADEYAEATAPWSTRAALADVPVVVLAWVGTDPAPVRATVELAREGGASVSGIVWLESGWELRDDASVTAFAGALGVAPTTAEALRREAMGRLAAVMAPASSAPNALPPPNPYEALANAGFLRLEAIDGADADANQLGSPLRSGARLLLATTSRADDGDAAVLETALRAVVEAEVPTVLAAVYREASDAPARNELFTVTRVDPKVDARVSTVDNLESVNGQVATVLALEAIGRGVVGSYGVGPGTTPVPEPPN